MLSIRYIHPRLRTPPSSPYLVPSPPLVSAASITGICVSPVGTSTYIPYPPKPSNQSKRPYCGISLQLEDKAIRTLRQQVKTFYLRVETDPHLLPANRLHLFDKSLLATQQLSKPQLQCWIRSVEEAIHTQSFRNNIASKSQRAIMERFFQPKGKLRAPSSSPPPRRTPLPQPKLSRPNRNSRQTKCQPYRFPFKPQCTLDHAPLSPTPPTEPILKQPMFTQPVQRPASPRHSQSSQSSPSSSQGSVSLLRTPPCFPRRPNRNPLPKQIRMQPKPRPRQRRKRPTLQQTVLMQRSLSAFGFLPQPPRPRTEGDALKMDFSESLLSTTP
jgi:hypothetical protein